MTVYSDPKNQIKQARNKGREGYCCRWKGYVTTLDSVTGKTSGELERVLGFSRGSLSKGYHLYFMRQHVGPYDFRWQGTTRHSGGWVLEEVGEIDGEPIYEYIQVSDQVRAKMNRHAENWAYDNLLALEQVKLNVRQGWKRIVKVVPKLRPDAYPDSPVNNIPQWEIMLPKEFYCAADVAPGHTYLGGGHGGAL